MKYACKKHGVLTAGEIIMWSKGMDTRWCIHCVSDMMNNYCGKLIKIEDDLINKKEKEE